MDNLPSWDIRKNEKNLVKAQRAIYVQDVWNPK